MLQEIPLVASPNASLKASPRSKTFKNKSLSHSTKEGLREAMKLAEVITDDKI